LKVIQEGELLLLLSWRHVMTDKIKILVVDDEEIVRNSLRDWLIESGYPVMVASDAFKALEILRKENIMILITDLKMPGMDGVELIKKGREINQNITAIIITAYGTISSAIDAMKSGAYDYIEKPFCPEKIDMILEKAVERQLLIMENLEKKESLDILNKSYLDLIGFVSHELIGILGGTTMSIATVRNGYLGSLTEKQKKSLDLALSNLDYFASTVKNFLNLSRIEKEEFYINKNKILIKEDIFDPSLENFIKEAEKKSLTITNNIETGLYINGDINLLKIVANNLIGNAVKYASEKGRIIVNSKSYDKTFEIEVYNDGRAVTEEEKEKLFKKFSRIDSPETKKAQGTGLGLFITKEIVEKHGGTIRVQPGEKGNSFIFTIEKFL